MTPRDREEARHILETVESTVRRLADGDPGDPPTLALIDMSCDLLPPKFHDDPGLRAVAHALHAALYRCPSRESAVAELEGHRAWLEEFLKKGEE